MTSPITSMGALQARFFEYYNAGDYQAALDLVRSSQTGLAHYAPVLAFWEAAMLARLHRPGEAMARIDAALAAGYWMHEDSLRGDPDFAGLLTQPGIDDLSARLREARLRDASETEPLLSIMEPNGTPPPWPLLLALHGALGNVNEFAPYWVHASEAGWLVAVPQSVQPMWVSGFYHWEDDARARHQITHHMHMLRELYTLEEDRIVLGGFSQGGEVAMRAALDRTIPARGFIGVEGWIFDLDEASRLLDAGTPPALRCALVAGENTEFHQGAQALVDLLRAHGIACTLEVTAVPDHGFPADFDDVLRRALDFVLGL